MTARLMVADSERDANMLYTTRLFVPDPFIWFEVRGRSYAVMSDLEIDRARKQARVDRVLSFGGADGTGRAVEHGSVRAFAAAEMVALDHAGEPAALADADHIHLVLGLELIHQHLVAGLEIVVAGAQRELAHELGALHAGLLEMAGGGLVDAPRLHEFEQAQLHRVIAVGSGRLALHHHAGTRLQQRHRHGLSVRPEHLRHSYFLAKDSWAHLLKSLFTAETPRH